MSKKTHHHSAHANNAQTHEESAQKGASEGREVNEEVRSRLIQVRAYGLWEQAGKPDGNADRERFWSEAEKELSASRAEG